MAYVEKQCLYLSVAYLPLIYQHIILGESKDKKNKQAKNQDPSYLQDHLFPYIFTALLNQWDTMGYVSHQALIQISP